MENLEEYFKKTIIIIFFISLSVLLIKYAFVYLSPFIIAAVLTGLIGPIVNKLEEILPLSRGPIVLIVLVLLIALIIIFIIIGISQVYLELNTLLRNLPDYSTLGQRFSWIIQQNNQLQEFIDNLDISPSSREMLNNNLQMIYGLVRDTLVSIINSLLNMLGKLPFILTILFLSFIATYFMSRDADLINRFIVGLFPGEWRQKVIKVEKELMRSAIGFIRAQLILISISGIIAGVGMIILGNQYALIVGLTAAILDLIPIIGPALLFYPWILYNLLTGNISSGIALLVLHTILSAVRSGAQGKVMGNSMGIHPLSIMIALYAGYRTVGPLGFIIGPTVLVVLKALARAELIPFKG